jgi:RHS repeat-associated protein
MFAETTATSTNTYVYGLDLSGTAQGAGTIGGILSANFASSNVSHLAFYAYDANGNVTDLVGTNGEFLAQYQFDPYGNTISKTGALADVNPFRFSTKYSDQETGLLYYGHRYYQPESGRWISRDPIAEKGGFNILAFCANSPAYRVDPFGKSWGGGLPVPLPSEYYGITIFEPKITVLSVTVNECCCSVNNATWTVDATYHFPSDPSHPIYSSGLFDQTKQHEEAHASTDDKLGQKAVPVAVSYMKSNCYQKSFFGALFGGGWNWSTADCKAKMDSEANAVRSYLQDVAYGTLQTTAHGYYGASPTSWNPAGVPLWHSWFDNWLAGKFNGGKFW